jgi:hypothetical protein
MIECLIAGRLVHLDLPDSAIWKNLYRQHDLPFMSLLLGFKRINRFWIFGISR